MHRNRSAMLVVAVGMLATLPGCGGKKLPGVSGTVTLDGEPVEKATVMFIPGAGNPGRMSVGVTDSGGHYTALYSTTSTGIAPGKYKVVISTYSQPVNDGEQLVGEQAPERIPDAYNAKSTLEADVTESGGTFDFDLKSSAGTVVQPKPVRDTN